jgi:hypothetical protein
VRASDAPGPAEIVQDGTSGWLVPPDNDPALAAALLEAASKPTERQRRGHHASIDARRRYSWTTIATQVAHLYNELSGQALPSLTREALDPINRCPDTHDEDQKKPDQDEDPGRSRGRSETSLP